MFVNYVSILLLITTYYLISVKIVILLIRLLMILLLIYLYIYDLNQFYQKKIMICQLPLIRKVSVNVENY